jgi:putative membrane protein insertion efficiency factor
MPIPLTFINHKLKKFTLSLIRFYQRFSPFHLRLFKTLFLSDRSCRFQPTCSEYTFQAVQKYGIVKGCFLGLKRIFRCHPLSRGGYDPLK